MNKRWLSTPYNHVTFAKARSNRGWILRPKETIYGKLCNSRGACKGSRFYVLQPNAEMAELKAVYITTLKKC